MHRPLIQQQIQKNAKWHWREIRVGGFGQILLKSCFEHGQLVKVSVREIKSIPQHSMCPSASGALIRIDFHPETAKK